MKISHRLLLLCFLLPTPILANDSIGKVIFYSYHEEGGAQEQIEANADFEHHVGGILNFLTSKNINHEIETKPNLAIPNNIKLPLDSESNPIPAVNGYIMIRPNGAHVIRHGLGTDLDMLTDIYEYFGISL